VHTSNGRQRQDDHEFEARLGYIVKAYFKNREITLKLSKKKINNLILKSAKMLGTVVYACYPSYSEG
jgi:hypothetical protein